MTTLLRPHLPTTITTTPLRRLTPSSFSIPPIPIRTFHSTPHRGAKLLQRPKRPHLRDQIIILSDGSSFKQLTTSPKGVVRTTKDARNHPLWNASNAMLTGVEEDEAGKLRAFRMRYGRGFDVEVEEAAQVEDDYLLDLFSSLKKEEGGVKEEGEKKEKGKKGKKRK